MPPPLLAFDMGNVLLPFDHTLACHRVASKCGTTAEAVYDELFKSGLEERFERGALTPYEFLHEVSSRLKTDFPIDWLEEAWSDIFFQDHQMLDLVDELSRQNDLHLISNTNIWHFTHAMARFPVLKYFANRTLSYEVHAFKPDSRMFQRITDQVGTHRLMVYIDDVPRYVEAASALGAQGLVFSSFEALCADLRRLGVLSM